MILEFKVVAALLQANFIDKCYIWTSYLVSGQGLVTLSFRVSYLYASYYDFGVPCKLMLPARGIVQVYLLYFLFGFCLVLFFEISILQNGSNTKSKQPENNLLTFPSVCKNSFICSMHCLLICQFTIVQPVWLYFSKWQCI